MVEESEPRACFRQSSFERSCHRAGYDDALDSSQAFSTDSSAFQVFPGGGLFYFIVVGDAKGWTLAFLHEKACVHCHLDLRHDCFSQLLLL